jgi:hypothetical protein
MYAYMHMHNAVSGKYVCGTWQLVHCSIWFLLPRLRELVVIDTQWVIDGISRIIREFKIHKLDVDDLAVRKVGSTNFEKLTDEGVLYHDLLQHLWSEPKFAQQQAPLRTH